MTLQDIKKVMATKRLLLTIQQTFWHYSIVPFILFIPALSLFSANIPFSIADIVFIAVALIFFIIQYRSLQLKRIFSPVSKEIFLKAVKQTASDLEWTIEYEGANFVKAHSIGLGGGLWTELIIIVRNEDGIYFRSICDPDSKPAIFSFMNKTNRKHFVNALMTASTN